MCWPRTASAEDCAEAEGGGDVSIWVSELDHLAGLCANFIFLLVTVVFFGVGT